MRFMSCLLNASASMGLERVLIPERSVAMLSLERRTSTRLLADVRTCTRPAGGQDSVEYQGSDYRPFQTELKCDRTHVSQGRRLLLNPTRPISSFSFAHPRHPCSIKRRCEEMQWSRRTHERESWQRPTVQSWARWTMLFETNTNILNVM